MADDRTDTTRGADPTLAIVLTTEANRDRASVLARHLVERGLAACVALHDTRSIYRWEGEVVDQGEVQLVIKTTPEAVAAVSDAIGELPLFGG